MWAFADAAAAECGKDPADPGGILEVPGGTFAMGRREGGPDAPAFEAAHPVTVARFYLDRSPVTEAEYAACVARGACKPAGPAPTPTATLHWSELLDSFPTEKGRPAGTCAAEVHFAPDGTEAACRTLRVAGREGRS